MVPLTRRAIETLRVLIERRGQLVEREELMNLVWGDLIVEDSNLTVTVSMLRKALGEDTNEPRFIETVPRLGYKFVADVREVHENVPGLMVEKQTRGQVVIDEEVSLFRSGLVSRFLTTRRHQLIAVSVCAALLVGAGAFVYTSRTNSARGHALGVKSIAVLPFRVISAPNDNGHQGLGLADLLITRLSNIKEINVRPTSAVWAFENSQESSAKVGQKLSVDAVLEGSITQVNDKLRVTARLIKVADESTIWAGQFEESAADLLGLHNNIALQVVDSLTLNLSGKEKQLLTKRYTENQDALQLYLRGRYQWNKRSYDGLAEGEHLFRSAIEKDPNFALAYVGLADSKIFFQNTPEVGVALSKALELDPNLAEAWATRGFQLTVHYWLWREAEEAFKKSIELNPGYATAHQWYATLLGIEGRQEEAKAELRRALEIDPTSYNFFADLGQVYYFNREYDKAVELCQKALNLNPTFPFAHQYLFWVHLKKSEYEQAIEELVKAENSQDSSKHDTAGAERRRAQNLSMYKNALSAGGPRQFYELRIREFSSTNVVMSNPNRWYGSAQLHALLGDNATALDCLDKAFESRSFSLPWLKADPVFDSLRSEPRFKAIVQKMQLPPDS